MRNLRGSWNFMWTDRETYQFHIQGKTVLIAEPHALCIMGTFLGAVFLGTTQRHKCPTCIASAQIKWPCGLRKLQKLELKALVYVRSWRLAWQPLLRNKFFCCQADFDKLNCTVDLCIQVYLYSFRDDRDMENFL